MSFKQKDYVTLLKSGSDIFLYVLYDKRIAEFINVVIDPDFVQPSPFFLSYDDAVDFFDKSDSNQLWKRSALLFDINNKEVPLFFDEQISFVIYEINVSKNTYKTVIKKRQFELMEYELEEYENTIEKTNAYYTKLKNINISINKTKQ